MQSAGASVTQNVGGTAVATSSQTTVDAGGAPYAAGNIPVSAPDAISLNEAEDENDIHPIPSSDPGISIHTATVTAQEIFGAVPDNGPDVGEALQAGTEPIPSQATEPVQTPPTVGDVITSSEHGTAPDTLSWQPGDPGATIHEASAPSAANVRTTNQPVAIHTPITKKAGNADSGVAIRTSAPSGSPVPAPGNTVTGHGFNSAAEPTSIPAQQGIPESRGNLDIRPASEQIPAAPSPAGNGSSITISTVEETDASTQNTNVSGSASATVSNRMESTIKAQSGDNTAGSNQPAPLSGGSDAPTQIPGGTSIHTATREHTSSSTSKETASQISHTTHTASTGGSVPMESVRGYGIGGAMFIKSLASGGRYRQSADHRNDFRGYGFPGPHLIYGPRRYRLPTRHDTKVYGRGNWRRPDLWNRDRAGKRPEYPVHHVPHRPIRRAEGRLYQSCFGGRGYLVQAIRAGHCGTKALTRINRKSLFKPHKT